MNRQTIYKTLYKQVNFFWTWISTKEKIVIKRANTNCHWF